MPLHSCQSNSSTCPEQGCAVLEVALGRALPSVLTAMHVALPRSAAEVALRQLIATFYLRSAIPSLKVGASCSAI